MENTSKALLIATAVLIAIILVAFGIKIMSSTKDASEQASKFGQTIQGYTQDATLSAIKGIDNSTNNTYNDINTPDQFNNKVFKTLKMNSNPKWVSSSMVSYKWIQDINKREDTQTALEEIKQLKVLCEQTGKNIVINIDDKSYSINDSISLLNSDEFKLNSDRSGKAIDRLTYIKADLVDGYIIEIFYRSAILFPEVYIND